MNALKEPYVLGIAASHNGAACLLKGDKIIAAVSEERLSRKKHHRIRGSESSQCIEYCLKAARISSSDLDLVVVAPQKFRDRAVHDAHLNEILRPSYNGIEVQYISHHLAHAFSAFCTSGFQESAVLIIDGVGSPVSELSDFEKSFLGAKSSTQSEVASIYHFNQNAEVTCLQKDLSKTDAWLNRNAWLDVECPRMPAFSSVGGMYCSAATQIFGDRNSAGKVMGLSAYGKPEFPIDDFFSINHNQVVWSSLICEKFGSKDRWPIRKHDYQALAASVQNALECAVGWYVEQVQLKVGRSNICYAGGVALNSVANQKIVAKAGFQNTHIIPSADDSGTAIGAAYFGLSKLTNVLPSNRLKNDFLGKEYSQQDVRDAVQKTGVNASRFSKHYSRRLVGDLIDKKIVGHWNGRSEFGPRALGNRSIFVDPRIPDAKEILNSKVKFREEFRPFGIAILQNEFRKWFIADRSEQKNPYMLQVFKWRKKIEKMYPSVHHIDGTCRVQTVSNDSNPSFYRILENFHARTGLPFIINTSLNVMGEPIVETPEDAIRVLMLTGLDVLYLDGQRINDEYLLNDVWQYVPEFSKTIMLSFTNQFSIDGEHSIERIGIRYRGGGAEQQYVFCGKRFLSITSLIDGEKNGFEILDHASQGCDEYERNMYKNAYRKLIGCPAINLKIR